MAHFLRLNPLSLSTRPDMSHRLPSRIQNPSWTSLQQNLKCSARFSCLFSDNRREEQARKALESALVGKKNELEKWNKEIKRREESGGRGDSSGGGWFGGGGGWFGWSSGDNFWNEAQQTGLTVLGIILVYLIVAKGEVMLAVLFNPLLYGLRGVRDGFTSLTSRIMGKKAPELQGNLVDSGLKKEVHGDGDGHVSAKERVVRKWRSD